MALSDDLLAQAKHLASKEPKRPRQASLRRAISAAYYALFHLLVSAGARALAPARPLALRGRVARAYADMKRVCKQFRQGNIKNLPSSVQDLITSPLSPGLTGIASTFVDLQEARHAADYDADEVFARPEVLLMIALVDQAFAAWQTIRGSENTKVFLAAMLLEKRWRSEP